MKRLSVKARVTLWYTALVALLTGVLLVFLFAFTTRTVRAQRSESLGRVVENAVRETELDDGELDTEDVVFYSEGVSVSFYDARGRLLAPRSGAGQVHALLEHDTLKTVSSQGETWMVYDVFAQIEGYGAWVRGAAQLGEDENPIRVLALLSLAAVPVFLLAAAAGGYTLMRRALRPVERMMETVDAINGGDELSLRIGGDGPEDEVSRLAATFDRMFDRLQASFEKEKQFTSDASHELRTPVAIIVSACELGLSKSDGEEELRDCLRVVLRQSGKMTRLIEQLLLLARTDDSRAPLRDCVDVSALSAMVCEEIRPVAEAAGLTLTESIAPDIRLTGDGAMLMRAITNLLENAVRYNRPGGTVRAELCAGNGGIVFRVRDTGIGIAPEHLPRLFDRFYRAESSRSAARGGTGLGLAMVRSIARRHGGSVGVESEEGAWTVFTLLLPADGGQPPS